MPLDLTTEEAPSLENFVPGDNQAALAALAACRSGEGPQFVYLWGPQGSGRTHLLRALTPEQTERVPAYREGVSLYTVDDVDQLDADQLEDLFVLMNFVRSNPGCRLVSAGSCPVSAMHGLRADVASRLNWGLTFALEPLSSEACIAEFTRLAAKRGIEITAQMDAWIEQNCPRDIKSLKEFLERIDLYALSNKKKVTKPLITRLGREHQE
jgi:DnaA family protein